MVAYELKNQASITARGGNRNILSRTEIIFNCNGWRNFGILSILGFSCTILGTWEGLLGTFVNPLQNGGSGGAVYAYIFAWVGTACTFVVLGEMGSMAPTSGGQYHWCAMLAPIKQQKFLSYITGWMAVMGWQTAFASASYLCGTEIQGTAILAHKLYEPEAWHGTLIVWAALVAALLANLVGGKFLPRLEAIILVIHIIGFFGILIPLVYMSEHKSNDEVFLQFLNSGEFPTQGISWFVGMTSCAFAFAGGDAAVHMAEEVNNASLVIPRALMMSVGINGCLGFGMLLAMLFCLGNMDDALNTTTGYPFIEVSWQLPPANFGRSRETEESQAGVFGVRLPMWSVLLTTLISLLLALINIGSSVALNDVLSMAVSGLYSSYLIVSVLLLFRRIKGDISRYNDNDDDIVNLPGKKLVWGPFHVPGIWGILINGFAVIYIIIVIFWSFWPTAMNPSVTDMNYSVVGWGGVIFLASLYYVIRARHIYTGPVVEISM
ncbi:amino acid permease [Penicillium cosmopolitanum]|uniref:Amino acid permease n=1 Tax=Penicillium cosmopolitanum TaxID=1131564 RepID=A0A9W9SJQ1_9EURO|nr:amino acid permease [Penicillium cosmopolitanum]KAJ5379215.1 amino acid permease [Penicillium cosmopolitanum]